MINKKAHVFKDEKTGIEKVKFFTPILHWYLFQRNKPKKEHWTPENFNNVRDCDWGL